MRVGESLRTVTKELSDAGVATPRLDAELLLAHCMSVERDRLSLMHDEMLTEPQLEKLSELTSRRISREPVQYIIGHREFWSIGLAMSPGVLIPRPETETLVEAAMVHLTKERINARGGSVSTILDIGTGSGAIAIAIATELKGKCRIIATDISPEAVRAARANSARENLTDSIFLIRCDMAEPLSLKSLGGNVDLIVSNPPYISSEELKHLQPEVRDYEPSIALYGGPDGLDYYPRLMQLAAAFLAPNAALIFEIAPDMPPNITAIWHAHSATLTEPIFIPDLSGHPRAALIKRLP
ncbi:MAG: peptide chain release factor N(5)-glutamine methyltransferase [Candidatus Coatesbacteria bacterium]|nr:peptide chain release factor N(5)-glutamine methyltransferase [Candidatus Coatesbacteria bacterium]